MQLSIYLRGAMMSFVSGYYGDDSSSVRAHGAFERLHFTRHGISQIHERRTVSRAVVKLPWNFDRNYPSPLCTRVRRYFPVVLFRSMRIHGSSRWNYRLLHGILDFSPWASGCILNPYSVGILASLSQTAILLRLYFLGRAITMWTLRSAEIGSWSTAGLFSSDEIGTVKLGKMRAYISCENLIWNALVFYGGLRLGGYVYLFA